LILPSKNVSLAECFNASKEKRDGTDSAGGVELRIWDEAGTFRVVYVAKLVDAIYVLHCFQKKTQQTAKRDIDLARKRLKELLKEIGK